MYQKAIKQTTEKINESTVQRGIMLFAILLAWSAIVLNAPVLASPPFVALSSAWWAA